MRFQNTARITLAMLAGSIALNVFTFVYTVAVCKGKDYCEVFGIALERMTK